MRLGNITSSRDAAMPEMWPESRDLSHVTDALLTRAFGSFLGSYEQVCDSAYIYLYILYTYISTLSFPTKAKKVVPQFSAVHVKGEALYKTVHRGEVIAEVCSEGGGGAT